MADSPPHAMLHQVIRILVLHQKVVQSVPTMGQTPEFSEEVLLKTLDI